MPAKCLDYNSILKVLGVYHICQKINFNSYSTDDIYIYIYAGFWIDTMKMILQMTEEKADKIVTLCTALLITEVPPFERWLK